MPEGKENTFNLDRIGVDVVADDLHIEPGALRQGQNAAFGKVTEGGGLVKRGGMARLNGSALGGAALGAIDTPLPDVVSRTLYAAKGTENSNTWFQSTDNGDTWTEISTLQAPRTFAQEAATLFNFMVYGFLSRRDFMLWAGSDYVVYPTASHTGPTLHRYDGSADVALLRIPPPPSNPTVNSYVITGTCVRNGEVFIACYDNGGVAPSHKGRVFRLNVDTGELEQVGNAFGSGSGEVTGGFPIGLCAFQGQLFAFQFGISGASVGHVSRINPDAEETWTKETSSLQGYTLSGAVLSGDLYIGEQGDAGEQARVTKRAADGTYSTSLSSGSTVAGNYFSPLGIYGTDLYAVHNAQTGPVVTIRKFDGTTWTTDRDVVSSDGAIVNQFPGNFLVTSNNDLFVVFSADNTSNANGFILRKRSGTWSKVLNAKNLRGWIGEVVVKQ